MRRDGVLTATYEYDQNGNRTTLTTPGGAVTGSYDSQDRLTSYGTTTYTYGVNGELKTKVEPGIGTTNYTYDALGNLVAVTLPDGMAIGYLIDGQNRRIGKTVNGTRVQGFLYQGRLAPVAELNGQNQLVSRFVYATRMNVPDYMVKSGQTYRLVLDQLGSVRLVVNVADGTVAQRVDYDEFGRVTQNTAPGFQPFGFAGGLLDQHTGLTRFGARDYDATTGRWTAKDPLGFGGGQSNLYAYVQNDPTDLLDPTGEGCRFTITARFLFDLAACLASTDPIENAIDRAGGERIPEFPAGTKQVEGIGSEEIISDLNRLRRSLRNSAEPFAKLKGSGTAFGVAGFALQAIDACFAMQRANEKGVSVWYEMLIEMGAAPEPEIL